jgi:hypothetical protein
MTPAITCHAKLLPLLVLLVARYLSGVTGEDVPGRAA